MAPPLLAAAYDGKTILITGGRGYIGSALTQALMSAKCRLIVSDRSPQSTWQPVPGRATLTLVRGDLSARSAWTHILRGVDHVFHLAGREYVRDPEMAPQQDWEANVLPLLHLLETCREHGLRPRIVFSSSANVIGAAEALPATEAQVERPLIPWSAHKLLGEHYLRMSAERHGVEGVSLRLSNVYGPAPRGATNAAVVLNRMIGDALAGRPVRLWPNSACVRDYLFLADAVRALLLVGTSPVKPAGISYFVGSGTGVSIAQAGEVIATVVGRQICRPVPIVHEADATMASDRFEMRHFVADTARFRSATGWAPLVSFEEGITRTVAALLTAGAGRALSSAARA